MKVYKFDHQWVIVEAVHDGAIVTVRYEDDRLNRRYHYHASDPRWHGRTSF